MSALAAASSAWRPLARRHHSRSCSASSALSRNGWSRPPWNCSGASNEKKRTMMSSRLDQLTEAEGSTETESPMVAPPCAMVIFGAAGDLTKRLVVPALYNLVHANRLAQGFRLVGVDLAAKTVEEWCKGLSDTMQEFVGTDGEFQVDRLDQVSWRWLAERMSYLQGDLNDPGTYERIGKHLAKLD